MYAKESVCMNYVPPLTFPAPISSPRPKGGQSFSSMEYTTVDSQEASRLLNGQNAIVFRFLHHRLQYL